ncbi:MAG: FimV/HubP family polar landmark protein [Pseudomonadota bacterium]
MRKLPLALACALILGTPAAFAIGLGELQTQSYLNQPLRATIPITDVRPGELDALSVKLGDEAQFARYGYSLMSIYGRIKLQVIGGERPHILLTSDAPVRDPALGLVLEVDGSGGTLERSVTILLDPEGYRPVAIIKPVVAVRHSAQSSFAGDQAAKPAASHRARAQAESAPMSDGGDYIVVSGDTAYDIAQRVKPSGVSLSQTIDMILQANPRAFADPADAGTLLAGKTLRIPNAQAMREARIGGKSAQQKAPAESQAQVAAPASEPRLDIVQPNVQATIAAPAAPVVAAPVVGEVVGEVVSAPAGGGGEEPAVSSAPQAVVIPVEIQERLEATKVENERLTGLLASQDERLQKMEELLRLNEGLIKEMEQKLKTASVAPPVPVVAPVESAAPWWSSWLVGLGGLVAALLAYFAGARRRSRDEPKASAVPSIPVSISKPAEGVVEEPVVTKPQAVEPVAVGADAMDVLTDVNDPVKAALEEADVMQAYGLHDRAIQVLSDALQVHPDNAQLMARRARAMHEAGDAEGFLRESEAFRARHPSDRTLWGELVAIGQANYAYASLFAEGLDSLPFDASSWTETSPAPAQEAAPDLAQALDVEGLGLGAADRHEEQPMSFEDMPPLELDLPDVSAFGASVGKEAYSPVVEAEKLVENVDDWAPLELPTVANVSPSWGVQDTQSLESVQESAPSYDAPLFEASPSVVEEGISAEDLATLGIDLPDMGSLAPVDLEFANNETEFSEDMQAISQVNSQNSPLDLDFIPAPVLEPMQESASFAPLAEEPPAVLEPIVLADLSLDVPEPVQESAAFAPLAEESPAVLEPIALSDLSLDVPATPEVVQEFAPLSLDMPFYTVESNPSGVISLDQPLEVAPAFAPMADMPGFAAAPASGMVSEQEVKIDIASAYLDMGDPQGAREMLQEVLVSDCDELLKIRAQNMLDQIQF